MNRVQMLMNPVQMFTMSVHMFRGGYWILWILGITRGDIAAGGIEDTLRDIQYGHSIQISPPRRYLAVNDAILGVNMDIDPMTG